MTRNGPCHHEESLQDRGCQKPKNEKDLSSFQLEAPSVLNTFGDHTKKQDYPPRFMNLVPHRKLFVTLENELGHKSLQV
jgi:hypothetical protein